MHRMKLEGEDPTLFGPSNRRHEPRLPLTFPIEVSGFDRHGHFFTEQSSCSDVGEASCAFRLRTEVEEDAVVAIRSFHWQNNNVLDSRPVLFQVARVESAPARAAPHANGSGNENGNRTGNAEADSVSTEGWFVAVVRLRPEQPQIGPVTGTIERAVS